jgi:hypothetical protein
MHEVRIGRAAYRWIPIQFGWSFLSDREKYRTAGIPKATYTAKVQAGKSVIKITTSQSAAVATNAIWNSLVNRSDLFWVMLFPRFACRRRISAEPVRIKATLITITAVSGCLTTQLRTKPSRQPTTKTRLRTASKLRESVSSDLITEQSILLESHPTSPPKQATV